MLIIKRVSDLISLLLFPGSFACICKYSILISPLTASLPCSRLDTTRQSLCLSQPKLNQQSSNHNSHVTADHHKPSDKRMLRIQISWLLGESRWPWLEIVMYVYSPSCPSKSVCCFTCSQKKHLKNRNCHQSLKFSLYLCFKVSFDEQIKCLFYILRKSCTPL